MIFFKTYNLKAQQSPSLSDIHVDPVSESRIPTERLVEGVGVAVGPGAAAKAGEPGQRWRRWRVDRRGPVVKLEGGRAPGDRAGERRQLFHLEDTQTGFQNFDSSRKQ